MDQSLYLSCDCSETRVQVNTDSFSYLTTSSEDSESAGLSSLAIVSCEVSLTPY